MKLIAIPIAILAAYCFFMGGYKLGQAHSYQTSQTALKSKIMPDTNKVDRFTVIRSSENGRDVVFSVGLPDSTGYDFLTQVELDSVLAGYRIDFND